MNELTDSLEAKGIKATPEDGQDDSGWRMWTWTVGAKAVMETSRCPKLVPEMCTDVEYLSWESLDLDQLSDLSAAIGYFNQRCRSDLHSDLQGLTCI